MLHLNVERRCSTESMLPAASGGETPSETLPKDKIVA